MKKFSILVFGLILTLTSLFCIAGTANIGGSFRTDNGASKNNGINVNSAVTPRNAGQSMVISLIEPNVISFSTTTTTDTISLPDAGIFSITNGVPINIKKVTAFFNGSDVHVGHSLFILSHGGASCTLYNFRMMFHTGGMNLTFDDASNAPISGLVTPANDLTPATGTFKPESPLSVFNAVSTSTSGSTTTTTTTIGNPASDARGPWKLSGTDQLGGFGGTWNTWGLQITTAQSLFQDSQGIFHLTRGASRGGIITSLFDTNSVKTLRNVTQP